MMVRRVLVAGALLLATGACGGDPTGSDIGLPTVLVTNATCEAGQCATLEIRAFVGKFTVPQGPAGLRILGEASPGMTCLTFPPSWTLRIIGPDTAGHVDTTTITWKPSDPESIHLIAVDSSVFYGQASQARVDSSIRGIFPYDGLMPGSEGETPNFAPGSEPGWSISFPSPRGSAALVSAPTCTS